MADDREERPDVGKIARDAGAEIGEAAKRAAAALAPLLDQAGERVSEALSGIFGGGRASLASHVLPELAPLHPLAPGDEVDTRVRLVNGGAEASAPFALSATDLVSEAGDTIAADAVGLAEHQRVIAGGTWDTVKLTLKVPDDAKPGRYEGQLKPDTPDGGIEPAPLVVEVR
jgi:hypothetical protein